MQKAPITEKVPDDDRDRAHARFCDLLPWLRAVGHARKQHGLAADEVLIFLALGQLGLRSSSESKTVWPVTCHEISELLQIPRETVRRKAARLIENDLVAVTGRGFLLKNIERWQKFVALLSE